jgi:hypothetical protein
MNRVRKFKDKWQVLITPEQPYNAGYELLRGVWYGFDDNYLRNYNVMEFNTLQDANCEAFKHPDIDWNKLVLLHQNAFIDIQKIIKSELAKWKFIVDFEARMMDSLTLKNTMFDRVMNYGSRFNLSYQMNDIISFHVVNPWRKNLEEISQRLEGIPDLRLVKKVSVNGVTHLIGETPLGTTYEVCLWPTIVSQWAKWIRVHDVLDVKLKESTLKQCLQVQKIIDGSIVLR